MRIIFTHSLTDLKTEKTFDGSTTVGKLKDLLYGISGTRPIDMVLQLKSRDEKTICTLDSEEKTLLDYNIQDYMIVHIIDMDETRSVEKYTDVSLVKKYEISEEKYEERGDTFRKWKMRNVKAPPKKKELKEEYLQKPEFKIGSRCEIQNSLKSRGEVKFVGETRKKDGFWVGVKFGNSNGVISGKRHFEAEKSYGLFVRFDQLKVGDYPEETFDTSDEEEI